MYRILFISLLSLSLFSCKSDQEKQENSSAEENSEISVFTSSSVKFSNNLKIATDSTAATLEENRGTQMNVVCGKVFTGSDEKSAILAKGVTISIKGVLASTISDDEGAYCISPVSPGDILTFTLEGYPIQKVTITGNPECEEKNICYSELANVILTK